MKHVFSVAGLGLAAAFVVVFFTGRIDSKHLTVVAPRVGMQRRRARRAGPARRCPDRRHRRHVAPRRLPARVQRHPDERDDRGQGARGGDDHREATRDGASGGGRWCCRATPSRDPRARSRIAESASSGSSCSCAARASVIRAFVLAANAENYRWQANEGAARMPCPASFPFYSAQEKGTRHGPQGLHSDRGLANRRGDGRCPGCCRDARRDGQPVPSSLVGKGNPLRGRDKPQRAPA